MVAWTAVLVGFGAGGFGLRGTWATYLYNFSVTLSWLVTENLGIDA